MNGGEKLKLTFVYNLKLNKTQEEIMWHSSKTYNMLNYEVLEYNYMSI